MIEKTLRFWHSIRHTRTSQLYHRIRLTLVRMRNQRFARTLRSRMDQQQAVAPIISNEIPQPLFVARKGMFNNRGESGFDLCFLNHEERFSIPLEWHRESLLYGTRLWLLNLHYMEFLEEVSDEFFEKVVDDWITNCPPFRSTYWKDDWNSYSLSIRVVVWMQQLAARAGRLNEEFVQAINLSLYKQLRFLRANLELDIGGNHLIKNIKALVWGGAFFSCAESQEWMLTGVQLLQEQLKEQILSDGVHYERSPAYHTQVFADLIEVYSLLPDGQNRQDLESVLGAMAQALSDFTHTDSQISLFNDGGLNMTYQPGECLDVWANNFGSTCHDNHHIELPDGGYFGYRRESNYVLVDCGKIAPDYLPAHGHGDILAFEWTLDGKRVFVDFGVFEYNSGDLRRQSRATSSHNTVTIGEDSQCDFWGSFRVARRAKPVVQEYKKLKDGFLLTGSHDGYHHLPGSPIHTRQFIVSAEGEELQIEDRVTNGKGQLVKSRLLVHPDFKVLRANRSIILNHEATTIEVLSDLPFVIESFYWCPDFGEKISCAQIEFDHGPAPCNGRVTLRKR